MKSSTEVLRRLLDERGVEYKTYIEPTTGFEHVKWNFGEHGSADFNIEFGEPWLVMYGTISGPAQAIDATLGRGTCRDVGRYSFVCSECGWASDEPHHVLGGFWPKYCPECGRAVVE